MKKTAPVFLLVLALAAFADSPSTEDQLLRIGYNYGLVQGGMQLSALVTDADQRGDIRAKMCGLLKATDVAMARMVIDGTLPSMRAVNEWKLDENRELCKDPKYLK